MKKVTLKDIAKLTGYNTATVSRSLNNNERIPLETREKIKKIACELNYTANISARILSGGLSKNIGVLIQRDLPALPGNLFTNIFWNIINEEISKLGYEPSIYLFDDLQDLKNKTSKLLGSSMIDGFLIFERNIQDQAIDFFEEKNYPYALLYYGTEKYKSFTFGCDNFQSGKLATKYLLSRGLKKIATVTSDISIIFKDRTLGYIEALKEAEITVDENFIFHSPLPSVSYGEILALEIAGKLKEIDSIFVQHDAVGLGMLKKFSEIGIKVPQDISIIGHDNLYYREWFPHLLTTISLDTRAICKNAVEYLIYEKIEKIRKIPILKSIGKIIPGETVI